MNGAELRSALELLFGEQWRMPAAEWLGINVRTVERNVNGEVDPPSGPIVTAVRERLRNEDAKRAWLKRYERWRAKGGRMGKFQRMILQNAADGAPLLTGRPEGGHYVGTWEAATLDCIDRGWLDEDRNITEMGRLALKVGK